MCHWAGWPGEALAFEQICCLASCPLRLQLSQAWRSRPQGRNRCECSSQSMALQERHDEGTRVRIKNADALIAAETMHTTWSARQNSRSRIHCALVISSRHQKRIHLVSLLCEPVAATKTFQLAQSWLPRAVFDSIDSIRCTTI